MESISSQNSDQIAAQIVKKTPVVSSLPYSDEKTGFSIDYGQSKRYPNDPTSVAILITLDGGETAKAGALDWIRFTGYDPSKLEIIYTKPTGSTASAYNPNTDE